MSKYDKIKYNTDEVYRNSIKEKFRHSVRKQRYGINKETYEAMVKEKEGKCDICGNIPTGRRTTLHVDHDHITGLIRGLLCNNCNLGLGKLGDSREMVCKINNYFNKSKTEEDIHNDLYEWMKSFL